MNTFVGHFIALTLTLTLPLALNSQADGDTSGDALTAVTVLPPPRPYQAEYQARASGMRTSAYRRLSRTADNHYEISHGLSLRMLRANVVTVNETSQFSWHADGALAHRYQFEQSGVRRRKEQVEFDWANHTALMTRDGEQNQADLEPGALDNLSFSVHMSALLVHAQQGGDSDAFAEGALYSFTIVDGREVDEQTYRVLGEETLSTPQGELHTLKAERVRDTDSRRSTVLWLAKDYDYVLVRLEQSESNGSRTELVLQSISME